MRVHGLARLPLALTLGAALALCASPVGAQSPRSEIYRALLAGAEVLSPPAPDRQKLAQNVRPLADWLQDPGEVPPRARADLLRAWSSWSVSGQLSAHVANDPLSHEVASRLFKGTSLVRYLPQLRAPESFFVENRGGKDLARREGRWVFYRERRFALWQDGNRYIAQEPPEGETLYLRPRR